jgi:tetratricopeptide (TPR) repeat protein
MSARVVAVVLVLVALAAANGRAEPPARLKPEARIHLDRGLKLYQRQKYDEAIDELREGLAIDPQPDLLYALGQAERKRGHCERAIEYYRSCLALVKDASAAAALRVQIERCRVEQGESAATTTATTPSAPTESTPPESPPQETPPGAAPQTPANAPPASPPNAPRASPPPTQATQPPHEPLVAPPPAPRPWHRDPLGATTLALGLAGLGAGGALVGIADARLDDAAGSYQQYADARGAPAMWTAGIVTLTVGGALVATAVIRYAVLGARHGTPPAPRESP